MNLEHLLAARLSDGFTAITGAAVDPAVRRSTYADYQSDAALALGRRLGRDPRDLATDVVAHTRLDDLCCTVTVSGPGFINLALDDGVLSQLLAGMAADARLGVLSVAAPETVLVDYSGPNVAKEMHVGHLRSTVIGDAVVRLLGWLGHTVIRVNHLGDWGTPFGMLIEHLLEIGEAEAAHELSVGDLSGFYQAARTAYDTDPGFAPRTRARVVALQADDEQSLALWRLLVAQSQAYFQTVYQHLDVELTPDDAVGESFYQPMLAPLVDELADKGLLRDSDGALCAFPAGFVGRDGEPVPLIVRKSDGGYGYAATDLAAIRHRIQQLRATRLLYVVGSPQRQHLAMVFQTARDAGWLPDAVAVQHVGFGSVLGADGRMLRTRAGQSVKLVDLLDEAVTRAAALVATKSPDLDPATAAEVAKAVGIGAVKYADLSTDRVKDYVFDWDRMLSFDGNSAGYLQMAHARICSILRKADNEPDAETVMQIEEPAEHALALELLTFPAIVEQTAATLEFHRLAGYLHRLATTYTAFWEHCPVLRADPDTRASRLALCQLTGQVLHVGLDLLGITTPERM